MWQRSPSWLSAQAQCQLGGPGSHTAAPGWKTAGVVGRARCFPDVSTSGSICGRRWRRRLAGADVQAASSVVKASRLVLALCLPPESTATGPERGITSRGGQKPLFYVKPSCPSSLSPQGAHPASSPWLLVARSPAPAPFQQGQCQPGAEGLPGGPAGRGCHAAGGPGPEVLPSQLSAPWGKLWAAGTARTPHPFRSCASCAQMPAALCGLGVSRSCSKGLWGFLGFAAQTGGRWG